MCSVSSRNTNFISPSTEVSPTTWSNMETKATNTLLISALSLCVLGGTVLSQHRHCTRDRCFALFQEPRDFPSAQKSCEDSAGEFLKFNSTEIETLLDTLPDGLTGSYWLELQTAEGKGAHVQLCAYISLSTGRNFTVLQAPCTDKLSGFLCQYVPCSSLQAAGDTQVMLGGCEHGCNSTTKSCTCNCSNGFQVSPEDPTRCERHCLGDCLASCIPNTDDKNRETQHCSCPDGYILDMRNSTANCVDINECLNEKPCDHTCVNVFGSFRCFCDEGFRLEKGYMCVKDEVTVGPDTTPVYPKADALPGSMPSYVKAGSALGIIVFMSLAAALLFLALHHVVKCYGRFDLSPFKHSNMDIFYLQQVTTDTYKRLSFDENGSKNNS
uniref:EGF-like domain-containing protein n=1 Tax=Mola mola TaxID=94237 RepID=A0A3Q3X493_MOLML